MKLRAFTLCLMVTAGAPAASGGPPAVHPDATDWRQLFAPDLSDAIAPAGVWSWSNGILGATEDQCIWTRDRYSDFTLDLEFRNAEGTNSGVFVYGSDPKNWIPNSIEIQIADDYFPKRANSPKSWQCGAIFGHKPAIRSNVRKAGEWNRMTITCRGPMIRVMLNGEVINEIDLRQWTSAKNNPDGTAIPPWLSKPLAELPTRGHIGLQGKHAGAPIEFRNIRIRPQAPR
ncbi:MAG TPA: DUF1080 domain-containing protein [Verrucomicrobiae bacterium]|nr:DUF1080 domain-containing protein [Verrucomicrobiae bacterium]